MKIGFDAKRVFHNFRGLGNYSRTLVEGVMEYCPDYEVHLYTPVFGDLRSLEWQSKFSKSHIHLPKNFLAKLAHPLWRSFGMATQIKNDAIDIYHGLSHEIPYGLKQSKVKTVVTVHDLIFIRYPEFFPWIDRQTYARKLRYATQAADRVLAICQQTKQDLVDFLKVPDSKIEVVYQGCSPDFYRSPDLEEINKTKAKYDLRDPFVLAVGALEARKNLLSLIEAFGQILDDVPHQLVLIGRGRWEYRKQMDALISRLKLQNRVRILDGMAQGDLPLMYHASDLFVYPSHFEGFGLPIVEAMFCKTPVVTSTGGCFPESGGPSSKYINPKDVESIAMGMKEVILDRNLHAKMAQDGYQYVQKFHLKNTSHNLQKFYNSL